MSKKNVDPPDKYICAIKNTMKNMYHKNVNQDIINIINDAVSRVSIIVFHTYNFLNLYFLDCYHNKREFPIINEKFIHAIMLIVSIRIDNRGSKSKKETLGLMKKLNKFYNKYYRPLFTTAYIVPNDKLSQILLYEAKDIVKNINNNISQHYIQHVRKFINISFDVKSKINKIRYDNNLTNSEKKIKLKEINTVYGKIKDDIFNPVSFGEMDSLSDTKYHVWIGENKHLITPCKDKYEKDSIFYDVKVNPQDYIGEMFTINQKIAEINNEIAKENDIINKINEKISERNKILKKMDNKFAEAEYKLTPIIKLKSVNKLFHVLPLRTSIIPKYITIDSAALATLILKKNKLEFLKNITKKSKELWSKIFNLNNSIFRKKGFMFHYMIKTDGINCSILYIKLKENGEPYKLIAVPKKAKKIASETDNCEYIENVEITEEMKNKLLVTIDPNHGNLISCMAENPESNHNIVAEDINGEKLEYKHKDTINFRYTRAQRNVETKNEKYKKIRETIKKSTKINEKTVEEIESKLTIHDSKTTDITKFTSYLKDKIRINRILLGHYRQPMYRKLKMNIYINTQKSESKMIAEFKKKFGLPEHVLIVFGDYGKLETMKGCEPHISKRLRKIFKNNGYELYKIDEYNTSKLCRKVSFTMHSIVNGTLTSIWCRLFTFNIFRCAKIY